MWVALSAVRDIALVCSGMILIREVADAPVIMGISKPRIISLKVNNSDISRLRDARDTIAVGQQGQVLYLLVEP